MDERPKPLVWNPQQNGLIPPPDRIEPPAEAAEVKRLKRQHYRNFDEEKFDQRIADFEKLDFDDPEFDLLNAVENVLRQTPNGGYLLPMSWDEIPPGNILWRARSISREDLNNGDITPSDLWEAPQQYIGPGRLNAANEPVLYTCWGRPLGTLLEARINQPRDTFILVGYKVWKSIPVRRIGVTNPDADLCKDHQRVEEKVSRFLAESLSILAFDDDSRIYSFTRQLLHTIYGLEPGWEVGWAYASTLVGPDVLNVAIEPEAAHARLEIAHVIKGEFVELRGDVISCAFEGYSDGRAARKGRLVFKEFPTDQFSSLQDYFDFLL
ncbi:hypothetical protein ACIOJF_08845 [Glutamicibacter sp. NPDC087831]|uniref:hypothetical protein n=1 Tax=Glutamicibacter sp. NPDC087831 TaxID=3363998 RepID=UPI0038149D9D